jgi:hypothetical protein
VLYIKAVPHLDTNESYVYVIIFKKKITETENNLLFQVYLHIPIRPGEISLII